MMSGNDFVIGTRGSPLALAQAHMTRDALIATLGLDPERVKLRILVTTGDAITDRALSEAGGKGLFTKEIDAAQLAGEVDIAVHSGKDLPTALPDGLMLAGFLPREDVRDAFIGGASARIEDLPQGATIGSASLRRQAQLRRLRPDLAVTLLRGNVGTRLAKVAGGEIAGTLLALAGLKRLGLDSHATELLDTRHFLPAAAQGAIGFVIRTGDARSQAAVDAISCRDTGIAVTCERAFLTVLDGSCRTPIAGHASLKDGRIVFRGEVLRPDGTDFADVASEGAAADAAALGEAAGRDLLARAPKGVLSVVA